MKTIVPRYPIQGYDTFIVILDDRIYPCHWDENGVLVADTHDGRYTCVWG